MCDLLRRGFRCSVFGSGAECRWILYPLCLKKSRAFQLINYALEVSPLIRDSEKENISQD